MAKVKLPGRLYVISHPGENKWFEVEENFNKLVNKLEGDKLQVGIYELVETKTLNVTKEFE
jgi:hypothetical protein